MTPVHPKETNSLTIKRLLKNFLKAEDFIRPLTRLFFYHSSRQKWVTNAIKLNNDSIKLCHLTLPDIRDHLRGLSAERTLSMSLFLSSSKVKYRFYHVHGVHGSIQQTIIKRPWKFVKFVKVINNSKEIFEIFLVDGNLLQSTWHWQKYSAVKKVGIWPIWYPVLKHFKQRQTLQWCWEVSYIMTRGILSFPAFTNVPFNFRMNE